MLFISSEISAQKVFRELFRSILLKKNQQGYLEIVEEKGETFCKFGELLISVKCLQSELQTTMNSESHGLDFYCFIISIL